MLGTSARLWTPTGWIAKLSIAIVFAATFAGAAAALLGGDRWFYAYNVPIAIPFAIFAYERLLLIRARGDARDAGLVLDAVVTIVALARAVHPFPFYSGHTLFTTYAVLTARSTMARISAAAVLAQVAVWKLALMHDEQTFVGGLLMAMAASVAQRRVASRRARR